MQQVGTKSFKAIKDLEAIQGFEGIKDFQAIQDCEEIKDFETIEDIREEVIKSIKTKKKCVFLETYPLSPIFFYKNAFYFESLCFF